MAGAGNEITVQVRDAQGQAYHVQFTIDMPAAAGSLAIRQEASGVTQTHALREVQKSRDGKTLRCTVGIATATLTIDDAQNPPQLHIQARVFIPVIDQTYTLAVPEQQRLNAWIQGLDLSVLA